LDVAKDVMVQSVMDIFELNCPQGKITRSYEHAIHGFAVSGVTEDEIGLFANSCNNTVVEVLENGKVHKTEEWGLDRIDDRALPLDNSYLPNANVNGAGVTVYILDTGVKTSHTEFTGRITQGIDFTGLGQIDGDGHGTHVAGTAHFFTTTNVLESQKQISPKT
jgi:subtilisin family serine protease